MRRHNIQTIPLGMMVGIALAMFAAADQSWAQTQKVTEASPSKPPTSAVEMRAELKRASDDYKSSLDQLRVLYDDESKRAEERLAKLNELLAQGLVTRREVDAAADAAAQTRLRVAEVQVQLKRADVVIGEVLVEAQADESPKARAIPAPRIVGGLIHTTAYIRYGGGRAWSLSDVGPIKQFFFTRFGHALPIHVFGQSALHDRWGYDHRNAMDVGLSPDSPEGQALIEYLRANGVPFTAFHFAVPGVATGPHIHVGLPSHRIAPASVAINSGK